MFLYFFSSGFQIFQHCGKQPEFFDVAREMVKACDSPIFLLEDFCKCCVPLYSSTDIDECVSGVHDCHSSASCTNTVGSYKCSCDQPYIGDGKTCKMSSGEYSVLV